MNGDKTKNLARTAMLTALALILSYVEALIPIRFGIPGIKLGLANLATVAALYLLRPADAFTIMAARVLLSGFLFGNLTSILYSFAGGLLSFLVMILLRRYSRCSVYGVSIAGGAAHNAGQLAVAILVVRTVNLVWYLPVLTAAGVLTGALIGVISARVLPLIRKLYPG